MVVFGPHLPSSSSDEEYAAAIGNSFPDENGFMKRFYEISLPAHAFRCAASDVCVASRPLLIHTRAC
jgi:hypothetical protein